MRPWTRAGRPPGPPYQFQQLLRSDGELLTYTILFLKRTYLRNDRSLSKHRPKKEEAELWIGQQHANYASLSRRVSKMGSGRNDVSEIRHFQPDYWTVGHVMKTGLVVPHVCRKIEFSSVEQYLAFFKNVLVRPSGSPYELQIAEKYCALCGAAKTPAACRC